MLNTLVCSMLLTLCVDVGWKPTDEGGSIYVIQIQPEQGKKMVDDGRSIISGIPEGIKEVQVQFGNDILLSQPPGSKPTVPAPKVPPKEPSKEVTSEVTSYLTTAIVSWIVSATFFATLIYLGWIHFDMRRRYQALLNRMLGNQSGQTGGMPSLGDFSHASPVAPLTSYLAEPPEDLPQPPVKQSQIDAPPTPPSPKASSTVSDSVTSEISETVSAIDKSLEESTSIEPGKEVSVRTEQPIINQVRETEEIETVYELPETSDDEAFEGDEDDDDNWEGVK